MTKSSGYLRFMLRKNKAKFKVECYCFFWAIVSVLLAHPDLVLQVIDLVKLFLDLVKLFER